ncbi:hypothetical protein E2562_020044 [Oryza meyeriana var. granulata]|uniref:Uncharacterized protein n=1 Tax=Oryza meyeriana var. granulata TaxID=110450 RepID=A0A6G1FAL6_9ORYZ|nr:hypothetical protein E2562_020044 [Oryza meyeriana var. granulata]
MESQRGQSPDRGSDASGPKQSSVSSHGRHRNPSSSICKDFLRKFVDNELLTSSLEDWFSGHSEDCGFKKPAFDVPFDLSELQNFDYAIEGVTFQQLQSHSPEIVEVQEEGAVNVKPKEILKLDVGSVVLMEDADWQKVCPELDSVEGALQWRETSWSRRVIQQKLGDVSAVLKAFADYVDSICGTPYPMDYEIWLRRDIGRPSTPSA